MKNYQTIIYHGEEQETHAKYAKTAKNAVVEIGVLKGDTSRLILENSTCKVFGVDPIIPDSMNQHLIGDLNRIESLVNEYKGRYIFINDFSYNAVKSWAEPIDYIFIDGDHNYEAVKKDYEDWLPFVKTDGVIAFHDSSANRGGPDYWPGPSQLADELIHDSRLEYLETKGTMTVFKKI